MDDFMVDMALRHFEFDDAQMARIKAAIPKVAYVAKLVKLNKTVMNELIDVFEMVATQVARKEQQ
jgi:hypothetical protein